MWSHDVDNETDRHRIDCIECYQGIYWIEPAMKLVELAQWNTGPKRSIWRIRNNFLILKTRTRISYIQSQIFRVRFRIPCSIAGFRVKQKLPLDTKRQRYAKSVWWIERNLSIVAAMSARLHLRNKIIWNKFSTSEALRVRCLRIPQITNVAVLLTLFFVLNIS